MVEQQLKQENITAMRDVTDLPLHLRRKWYDMILPHENAFDADFNQVLNQEQTYIQVLVENNRLFIVFRLNVWDGENTEVVAFYLLLNTKKWKTQLLAEESGESLSLQNISEVDEQLSRLDAVKNKELIDVMLDVRNFLKNPMTNDNL